MVTEPGVAGAYLKFLRKTSKSETQPSESNGNSGIFRKTPVIACWISKLRVSFFNSIVIKWYGSWFLVPEDLILPTFTWSIVPSTQIFVEVIHELIYNVGFPLEDKLREGRRFCLFRSLLYPQYLEQCLAYSSVNICRVTEWINCD